MLMWRKYLLKEHICSYIAGNDLLVLLLYMNVRNNVQV